MAQQARQAQLDREIEVDRKKLIDALKANRERHIAQYNEAVEGYRDAALEIVNKAKALAVARMERNFEKIRIDLENFNPDDGASDRITLIQSETVDLPVPRNYSKDYDAAIDIAEWDVNDKLKLSFAEFQCFVRDEWDWTNAFVSNSAMYVKGSRR
ncbi:hypothetical protein N9Y42_08935 [Mariniblastus sp.]|nr:hypothetical protein [Mariniblastus sp.]